MNISMRSGAQKVHSQLTIERFNIPIFQRLLVNRLLDAVCWQFGGRTEAHKCLLVEILAYKEVIDPNDNTIVIGIKLNMD